MTLKQFISVYSLTPVSPPTLSFRLTTRVFIVLMDGSGLANIVQYGSTKSIRVTRSVFSAEFYAMIHGFDNAFVLLRVLNKF